MGEFQIAIVQSAYKGKAIPGSVKEAMDEAEKRIVFEQLQKMNYISRNNLTNEYVWTLWVVDPQKTDVAQNNCSRQIFLPNNLSTPPKDGAVVNINHEDVEKLLQY